MITVNLFTIWFHLFNFCFFCEFFSKHNLENNIFTKIK